MNIFSAKINLRCILILMNEFLLLPIYINFNFENFKENHENYLNCQSENYDILKVKFFLLNI